ncbi:hypothetical protein [Roseovarius faecimaris]|nr:hypothetical protein [Roseovarius faecimaris]
MTKTHNELQNLAMRERAMAVSEREWKHRLRGYGYAIKDTSEGRVLTSIRNNTELCPLPGLLA